MNFSESMAFYLVVGLGVGVAQVLADRPRSRAQQWWSAVAGCCFWPLYLPLLLTRPGQSPDAARRTPDKDDLDAAIEQVDRELSAAFSGLDGWADHVLERWPQGLGDLRAALATHAERIRQMNVLLAAERAESQRLRATQLDAEPPTPQCQRARQARQDNMHRLEQLRQQARGELLATLAWIRELVSMMHLARFTGAPPARAEELVAQIAAAVEVFSLLAPDDARSTSPDPSHPAPLTTPTLPSNPQEIDHGILLAKP